VSEPIPERAFEVAAQVRRLTLLARLTQHHVPVNGDRSWVQHAIADADPPMTPFEQNLIETAGEFDWLLAEVLLRLYNGATAGLDLVDFIAPNTVLAIWFALRPDKRRYLRAVFGTATQADTGDPDRLAVLDRLVNTAGEEVPAAIDLLGIITTPNPVVEEVLADADTDLPVDVLLDLRQFSRELLTADSPDAVQTLIDERWPERELPPKPQGAR
jgi:hypothetical protein